MSESNVGKIHLRSLTDLLSDTNDVNGSISKTTTVLSETPENTKLARTRAATTTKKNKNTKTQPDAQIIVTSTVVKRTGKKLPLPGQLRIDSFFKSGTKTYKVEQSENKSHSKSKPRRTPQKSRKRLFEEASVTTSTTTTTTSCYEEKITKPPRRRVQPTRNVKGKCNPTVDDVIDLCSDEELEIKKEKTLVESESAVTGILKQNQPESISMVTIPRHNLRSEISTETSSKENIPKLRKRKICPSYKVVEGTTFVVDGFQFGDIPNATHYFLSHYHADHYIGLTRKFAHPLYMSPITASLVRTFIPIDNQYLHEIDVGQTITVKDIEITAIDANHCPGALLLLFKFNTGKCILHTGDFRASFEMESLPVFWNHPNIDVLYLDTTYLSENYDFCHQSDSIDKICFLLQQFHEKNICKRILHVCGTYLIGKEKLWLAVAERFDLRIWTEPHRRKAIDCLNWPEVQIRLCDNPQDANLHLINMGKISYPQLDQYFKPFEDQYDMLVGIRPSGWEKNSKPSYGKRISVIGVEYSEHSSYRELERFVRFLKPKKVISTVPIGRDLCVTPKVPVTWYQYKGNFGMLSKNYQPSISTFLTTPQRTLPSHGSGNSDMILSPLQEDVNNSPVDAENYETPIKEYSLKENSEIKTKQICLESDASDDLLSFK